MSAPAEIPDQAKPALGAVEVLKDEHSRMWYSGHVLDFVGKDKLRVGFDGGVWPNQEFAYSRVRKQPKPVDLPTFNPRIGDEVELKCVATEHQPAGWGAAIIKNTKHSFFFVSRVSNVDPDGKAEAIVEKSMLRPCVRGGCLDDHVEGAALKQTAFKIAPGLQDWLSTDDAMGCFARIESDSGLMFIKVGRSELKLFGTEKAAARAKMLLDVHQKHQVQIQNFQDMREKRLSALEKRRNRIEGTGYKHSLEIQIDPAFVKRVIGTKGENIRAVMQKYDVNIHIPDADDDSSTTRTVRIFGNTTESIEKARGEVEFIEEVYPDDIDSAMFNWMRGRGGKTINTFKDLTGIMYARLDRDSKQMTVCGTRNAVEDAMAMFESHMMYYPVFSQMDEEMEQLVQQLEEYGDTSARWDVDWHRDEEEDDGYGWGYGGGKSSGSKGKAKGAGKGKDRGNQKYESQSWGRDWNQKSDDWRNQRNDDWNGNWREQTSRSEARDGKSGKGKSKGSKGGKGRWEEDEEEVTRPPLRGKGGKASGKHRQGDDYEDEEEPEPRGRGRGRTHRGPRVVDKEEEDDPDDASASTPIQPAASRKMGRKGIRTG